MTTVHAVPPPDDPASVEYWNGAPPPFAPLAPDPLPFWSRSSTWLWLAAAMIVAAVVYFGLTAVGSLASAPGGCGGG